MNTRTSRCFDSIWLLNFIVPEVGVDCNTISFELRDIICNSESCKAKVSEVFLSDIIRKLRLVEVNFTTVSVPLNKITKTMLGEKAISSYVVSIDLQSVLYEVSTIQNTATDVMVRPPQPGMIYNHILVVNFNHLLSGYFFIPRIIWTTNTPKNITYDSWGFKTTLSWICAPFKELF